MINDEVFKLKLQSELAHELRVGAELRRRVLQRRPELLASGEHQSAVALLLFRRVLQRVRRMRKGNLAPRQKKFLRRRFVYPLFCTGSSASVLIILLRAERHLELGWKSLSSQNVSERRLGVLHPQHKATQ